MYVLAHIISSFIFRFFIRTTVKRCGVPYTTLHLQEPHKEVPRLRAKPYREIILLKRPYSNGTFTSLLRLSQDSTGTTRINKLERVCFKHSNISIYSW